MARLVLALTLVFAVVFVAGCQGESAEDKALSSAAPNADANPGPSTPPPRAPGADQIMRGRR